MGSSRYTWLAKQTKSWLKVDTNSRPLWIAGQYSASIQKTEPHQKTSFKESFLLYKKGTSEASARTLDGPLARTTYLTSCHRNVLQNSCFVPFDKRTGCENGSYRRGYKRGIHGTSEDVLGVCEQQLPPTLQILQNLYILDFRHLEEVW